MIHFRALLPLAIAPFVAALGIVFGACSSEGNPHTAATTTPKEADTTKKETRVIVPVDYSLGRAMNARIGKGINLGNSWDSDGNRLDSSWGNPIRDYDFPFIKKAGFNSVRIPVRWQRNSDYSTHTVDPERLAGVKEDIQLAIDQGLVVIVNFHHYVQLNCAGGGQGCTYDSTAYEAEKAHFLGMWAQVAQEMDAFPDSMIVFEILNEPTISNAERVDNLMNEAYAVIRSVTKTKTIMFESYHSAKFEDLNILHLPADGNIIYTGHYYEPYGFSHQGHSYNCKGDAAYNNKAFTDLELYAKQAKALYPDVDGVNSVPLNMGEFGISGGTEYANKSTCKEGESLPSAKMKAQWASLTIKAAEAYGMSWNYWGFTSVGGFEAAHHNAMDENIEWYEGFPAAFGL